MGWPNGEFFTNKGYAARGSNTYVKITANGNITIIVAGECLDIRIHEDATGAISSMLVTVGVQSNINHMAEIFVGYFLNAAENTLNRC